MEYGGGTQNWTITRDNNGWIYAANNSGLLQFDGYSWHLFSNGMIIRTAYHDGKEHIYVGAFNNFGYFSPDEKGAMHYHSLSDSLEDKYRNFSDVWDIYCIDHSIYLYPTTIYSNLRTMKLLLSKVRNVCSAPPI